MSTYTEQNGQWTQASGKAVRGLAIRVAGGDGLPETPAVEVLREGEKVFRLVPRAIPSGGETLHTVAGVDADTGEGTMLFTFRAEGDAQVVDDLRPADRPDAYGDDVMQGVRDDLDEILIPVYIDDAIEALSEDVPGLVALHTAQFDAATDCTYFRTSVFRNGELLLEEEAGAM
jgi:hypothetical protein